MSHRTLSVSALLFGALAWGSSCVSRAYDCLVPISALPFVPRRDLLEIGMPDQQRPTEQRLRVIRDQRSFLRRFTIHRVDFAY